MKLSSIRRRVLAAALIPTAAAVTAAAARYEAPEAAPEAARRATLRLHADISQRQLHLYSNGELIRSYPVAVGTAADPTPRGAFKIRKLVWNPGWVPPDEKWARNKTPKGPGEKGNPMKVVKIFFREPDYYIHGTGDIHSLGKAASHGCLRMAPSEAAELAQMVMESGGSSFGWDTIRRWLRLGSTRAVTLKRPVTLQIS